MRLGGQDAFDQRNGGRANRLGLVQQPGGHPLGVAAVGTRHVVGDRGVAMLPRVADLARHPVALVEQFEARSEIAER